MKMLRYLQGHHFFHLLLLWLQVLLGKSTCTEKIDMYSYGVVLWEICAGEAPTGRQLRPLRCAITATTCLDLITNYSATWLTHCNAMLGLYYQLFFNLAHTEVCTCAEQPALLVSCVYVRLSKISRRLLIAKHVQFLYQPINHISMEYGHLRCHQSPEVLQNAHVLLRICILQITCQSHCH